MSELETKRNSIMNAIASGTLTNLLANKTWADGYFQSGGGISSQTTSLEKYESEYIDVDTTKAYIMFCVCDNQPTYYWYGIGEYTNEETWVKRQASQFQNGYSGKIEFTNPKIRVSLRTFGGVDCVLVDYDEFLSALNLVQV